MRRILLVGLLAVAPCSQAQIPVTDGVSIAGRALEHALVIQKWVEQIREMERQFNQLEDTYRSMTGVRNLGDIFSDPELRQYLPDDWQRLYRELKSNGYEGLIGEGATIYAENKIYDACAHIADSTMRLDCEARASRPSQDQGDIAEAYDLVVSRGEQLKNLQSKINSTTDAKGIAELQARIAVEQAAIANEETRLGLANTIMDSEQRVQQQRQKEFQARNWSATKGIEVEPLTFEE